MSLLLNIKKIVIPMAILSSILCLYSCGPIKEMLGQKKIDHDSSLILNFGIPVIYPLADPECSEEDSIKELGEMKVWIKNNEGEAVLAKLDLSSYSGRGLKGPGVKGAFHSSYWNLAMDCVLYEEAFNCPNGGQPQNSKLVNICREQGDYPRRSIENAALASLYSVKVAHDLHRSIKHSKDPSLVSLLILPKVYINEVVLQDEGTSIRSMYMTDNAFWDNHLGQAYIAVLPHSLRVDKKENSPNDHWERLGIMAHEYGHHVFATHAPGPGKGHSLKGIHYLSTRPKFSREIKHTYSAINESFADMWAYNSFERVERDHPYGKLILGDQTKDRDLLSNKHDDDTSKILSRSMIDEYFEGFSIGQKFMKENQSIDSPIFSDCHAIGAILAYGLNECFSLHEQASPELSAAKQVSWAEAIEKSSSSFKESPSGIGPVLLKDVVNQAMDICSERSDSVFSFNSLFSSYFLNKQQCDSYEGVFPEYDFSALQTRSCPL